MSADFEIAPGFKSSDWKKLRRRDELCWETASSVLKNRLTQRFLEPANELEKLGKKSSAGMSEEAEVRIFHLALDFIVMETVQAFREGFIVHKQKSKLLICNYLLQSHNLSKVQGENVYEKVRCAIHHSGSTDVEVKVKVSGPAFDFRGSELITINRRRVHSDVSSSLISYVNLLRSGEAEQKLRDNFLKKMDAIAGL